MEVWSLKWVVTTICLLVFFGTFVNAGDIKTPVPYYGDPSSSTYLIDAWRSAIVNKYEYAGYDGWYNNLAHPDWGAADMPMLRRVPHAYQDGVYLPSGHDRPNPINISDHVMHGTTGRGSLRNRTAFLVFFGQQVVEEILDAQRPGCPPEYFNITVPKNHHLNPENLTDWYIPLLRSRYDQRRSGFSPNAPREQLNEITPWIDGGLMYGVGKAWADALRSFKGGRLRSTLDTDGLTDSEIEDVRKKYGYKDYPAVNNIRLPMANPPPPRDHYLKNVNRFFPSKHFVGLGNPRGNENPFLLSFGIMWYRYHNAVANKTADILWKAYQDSSVRKEFSITDAMNQEDFLKHYDEKIFNEARKWVIATHQKIVMYDWLPSWLGTKEDGTSLPIPAYQEYNPNVHPQIMHVFQSAAMRFGHTLVPPGVLRRMPKAQSTSKGLGECYFHDNSAVTGDAGKKALRTCNVYWNPQEPINEYELDDMLLGMSSQITEREDSTITPDLRGFVFGGLDFSRRDLMAVNIQRGRDHGLPDYNTARKAFGLEVYTEWTQINKLCNTTELIDKADGSEDGMPDCRGVKGLREVYNGDINNMDIWPAGISETTGDGPGELFRTIILNQFTRIRDADRFWYENKLNGLFDDAQKEAIERTNIRQVILSVTNIEDEELAGNPFFYRESSKKCEVLVARAQADNLNTAGIDCSAVLVCSSVRAALENANPGISRVFLDKYADCDNSRLFVTDPCKANFVVNGSNPDHVASCTPLKGYDYFTGSDVSYILTFLFVGLFAVGCVGLLIFTAKYRQISANKEKQNERAEAKRLSKDATMFEVTEWQGFRSGRRSIKVKLDSASTSILVYTSYDTRRRPTRTIDCKGVKSITVQEVERGKEAVLLLRVQRDYDLVLAFDDHITKNSFRNELNTFSSAFGVTPKTEYMSEKELYKQAVTKSKRQKVLDRFFRVVFKQAFQIKDASMERLSPEDAKDITECHLTIYEFADALSLQPNSVFVRNMFELIDKDKDGQVNFREFLDMMVIFAKGGADQKARLLFDMYDVSGRKKLSKEDFRNMLKSLMDLANTTVENEQIDQVVESMFQQAGLITRTELTFDDFSRLLKDYKQYLDCAQLDFGGQGAPAAAAANAGGRANQTVINLNKDAAPNRARRTIVNALNDSGEGRITARQTAVRIEIKGKESPATCCTGKGQFFYSIINYIENYRLHIFWVLLYTLVYLAIFAERAYYYSVEREHAALRRIAGYGVTVTRGAASAQMFTYSTLLLTMCRNLITALRETFFNRFIPFDAYIWFHKYVAYLALISTIIHVLGHSINFYHISTQPPFDVACLFNNFFRATHILPTFHYWCWGTITGITGVILTLIIIVIFVFAQQYSRRHLFRWFWNTHQLFYAVFILMILHGIGMLVQPPILWTFMIAPLVIFAFDKMVSLSRNKTEISITKAEILPSNVTGLFFKKPAGFEYRSGQWIRIACLTLGDSEYHPFTLTSAPHEDQLSLHIRAVGPWTTNIRKECDKKILGNKPYPKLYIDGPFGEGHQDWYKYEIAVLVGGGIGVTPFASILKDIVHRKSRGAKFDCKKVYFLWTTKTQKNFEWLVDIIREVEENDKSDFVSVHLFITQFYQKFDLRTTMLYICERHFQKISNKSLFTGLRSITHFGRPDFKTFLPSLKDEHPGVSKIGVFSCGPPQMTHSVEESCLQLNKERSGGDPAFVHHYENF